MKSVFAFVCAMLAASPGLAAEVNKTPGILPEFSLALITQFGAGLLLIIGLIYLLAFLSKKIQGNMKSDASALKLVSGLAVGSRERLMLVQVYGEQVLIGVTPGQVSALHVVDRQKILAHERLLASAPHEPTLSDAELIPMFASLLEKMGKQPR